MHPLADLVARHGFAAAAVCSTQPFDQWLEAVRQQAHPAAPYGLEADPAAAYPFARQLWVLATPYRPYADIPDGCMQFPAFYQASNACYAQAHRLCAALAEHGVKAEVANRLPAKPAALRSGAGEYGLNGLFFWRGLGSRVALTVIASDTLFPQPAGLLIPQAADGADHLCNGCGACLAACPTCALPGDGRVTGDCLRRHMLSAEIPAHLQQAVGMRALGCDTCQAVCPQNPAGSQPLPDGYAQWARPDTLLAMPDDELAALCRRLADVFGKNYARPNLLRLIAQHCKNSAV